MTATLEHLDQVARRDNARSNRPFHAETKEQHMRMRIKDG
jgi:hypothetical protein